MTTETPLEKLQPALDRIVIIWEYKLEQDREDFRATLQKFIRLYGFILQIITFEDVALDQLYVFAKALNRKLPRRQVRLPYEIRDGMDLDSFRLQETYTGSIELEKEQGTVPGFGDGSLYNTEDEKDLLSHIITTLNETYGINLTEDDKVDIQRIRTKLEVDEALRAVLNADNPRDAKVYKFKQEPVEHLVEFVHTKLDLYKKLTEPKVNEMLKRQWFELLASGMSD
jgi:type I restriction enzyme, R subunit